ncbi:MAG: hypothetical protein OEU90_03345 [Gammaproteobacteria bacterium]|nr:hypothetical protein [Gammaproteobacteria bacterium]
MLDFIERLAASNAAFYAIWVFALVVFTCWLIFEIRGMIFTSLIRWKPLILRSLRAGFLLSLIFPVVLLLFSGLAGPWGAMIFVLGIWYLPPSVYILCTSLGLLHSILRERRTLRIGQKRNAYVAFAALATIGVAMLYVSFVWLDKPV